MSYIFKYIDNQIYRNGHYFSTFQEFMSSHPDFPLKEGEYFEYSHDAFSVINDEGHHLIGGGAKHQNLIRAINEL